jgi:MFS transporter, DHA3 family, macrolide efflux protein
MSGNKGAASSGPTWPLPFFTMWGTQTTALLGAGMVQFALVWWIASTTGSAVFVGLATAIALAPRIFLNPLIGALSDRYDRRLLMIASGVAIALCSISLFCLVQGKALAPWHIFAVLMIRATADTLHGKSMISSTSMMVPPEHLTRIAGINQALAGIIMFLTPALGAYLLTASSFAAITAIDFSVALAAIIPLLFIRIPRPGQPHGGPGRATRKSVVRDMQEGFIYLRDWPGAIGMLCISAVMNLFMQPYFALLSIFVKDSLHGGETEFGILGAISGLGFMLGGVIIGIWQGHKKRMVTSLIGIAGAGFALLWSGAMSGHGLAAASLGFFAAGVMMPLCMGPIQSLVQSSVRNDIQARVFSIIECASNCAAPIGLIAAGFVFDKAGPSYWYYAGGVAAIAAAVIGLLDQRVRNLGYALRPSPRLQDREAWDPSE